MQTAFNAIQSMHTHTFKPESFVVPTAIYCLAGDLFVTQFKDLLHAEQLQEKFWTFFSSLFEFTESKCLCTHKVDTSDFSS